MQTHSSAASEAF